MTNVLSSLQLLIKCFFVIVGQHFTFLRVLKPNKEYNFKF